VPAFFLKLLLGEMSIVVLGSTKASSKKIENAGFQFKYPEIEGALKDIYV
jgi:NAD dependent epimerase/dehydratase family enzyme